MSACPVMAPTMLRLRSSKMSTNSRARAVNALSFQIAEGETLEDLLADLDQGLAAV